MARLSQGLGVGKEGGTPCGKGLPQEQEWWEGKKEEGKEGV